MVRSGRACWFALACALGACGGEGGGADGGDVPVGGGEVTAPWDAYCVATFTEDFAIVDSFGDVELKVKAGSRYLLSDVGGFGVAATILYLSGKGPVELGIEVEGGAAPPFSSSCGTGVVEELVGVFSDVTVYADEGLTMASCTLTSGSALRGGGLSYGLVSGDLFMAGGVYQVWFGGLAAACGGLDTGFVEASSVMLGSTQYTGLPIASVLGPGP